MKRFLRILLPLLVLAIGITGFAALVATRPESPPVTVGERVWRVEAETVSLQSLASSVLLHGRIDSPRAARLRSAVEADVLAVAVAEGELVGAGDILVQLDRRELALRLAQSEAERDDARAQVELERLRRDRDREALQHEQALLNLAERGVARARDLLTRDLGSQAALDEAQRLLEQQRLAVSSRRAALNEFDARMAQLEARVRRTEAQFAAVELDLERSRLVAPFPARITRVAVAPGDRVRVGDALVELFDHTVLEVRATLPTRHLAVVETALERNTPLPARGEVDGRPLNLELERLAGSVAGAGAGVEGLFRIVGAVPGVPLGRFVTLRLALPVREHVVALPFEALYGSDRIYRLEQGRMRALRVERIGEWQAPDGEIRLLVTGPDLTDGDRIVTTRLPNAVDGLRVTTGRD